MLGIISYFRFITRCSEHILYISRVVPLVYIIKSACVYLFMCVLYCT
jgi:hypothetical protein